MQFQASLLLALVATVTAIPAGTSIVARAPNALESRQYGGPATTGEVCPQAQDLWYLTTNNFYYLIACAVDTAGDTAIAVYPGVANVLACAQ